jgi:hypothetical protein
MLLGLKLRDNGEGDGVRDPRHRREKCARSFQLLRLPAGFVVCYVLLPFILFFLVYSVCAVLGILGSDRPDVAGVDRPSIFSGGATLRFAEAAEFRELCMLTGVLRYMAGEASPLWFRCRFRNMLGLVFAFLR